MSHTNKVKMILKQFHELPKRLMRITSSGRYIAEVDGLRFMAIMPVLIQHLSERIQRYSSIEWSSPVNEDPVAFLASRGTIGVFIFFAISGFILSLPFAKYHLQAGNKVKLRSYFWRRITRLEPPYIFWMSVFFLILLMKGGESFSSLFPHLGASLLYVHNIVFTDYSTINPVAWSLEIEIQFYLLAPLLAYIFFRWPSVLLRRSLMVGSIIGMLIAQQHFGWAALPYKLSILWQLHYFLVGFLITDLFLTEWKGANKQRGNWIWDIVAPIAFLAMCFSWSTDFDKRMLFSLALLLFMIAGFRGCLFTAFLRRPWIAVIGGMCYTIYLIHLPLLEGLSRLSTMVHIGNIFSINLLLQMLLLFPIIFAVASFGFLFIEKPCMDKHWPQKLIAKIKSWSSTSTHLKKIKEQ